MRSEASTAANRWSARQTFVLRQTAFRSATGAASNCESGAGTATSETDGRRGILWPNVEYAARDVELLEQPGAGSRLALVSTATSWCGAATVSTVTAANRPRPAVCRATRYVVDMIRILPILAGDYMTGFKEALTTRPNTAAPCPRRSFPGFVAGIMGESRIRPSHCSIRHEAARPPMRDVRLPLY
jgi:hypothetical protein